MNIKREAVIAILGLSIVASTWAGVFTWPWMTPPRELILTQQGNTLIATLSLQINNSPAIIETDSQIDKHNRIVTLSFSVVQNRDLYSRGLRGYTVRWEIPSVTKEEYKIVLNGADVSLTTDQLKSLLTREGTANKASQTIGAEAAPQSER